MSHYVAQSLALASDRLVAVALQVISRGPDLNQVCCVVTSSTGVSSAITAHRLIRASQGGHNARAKLGYPQAVVSADWRLKATPQAVGSAPKAVAARPGAA
jgi:hypothetical protein